MNWKKSMTILGLSACFLAMTIPAMAADELKSGEKPSAEIRENSMMTKNLLAMLVTDGTISESTYDAIEEYLQQNPPTKPDGGEIDGQEPPAKPDGGEFDGLGPQPPMAGVINQDILDKLLAAGVVTEDEYSTISANLPTVPEPLDK